MTAGFEYLVLRVVFRDKKPKIMLAAEIGLKGEALALVWKTRVRQGCNRLAGCPKNLQGDDSRKESKLEVFCVFSATRNTLLGCKMSTLTLSSLS
jgi:hypothetical protein